MKILFGLGNSEERFVDTRHNVGRTIIADIYKKLTEKSFLDDSKEREGNLFIKTKAEGKDVVLAMPAGYMNESGEYISAFVNYFKYDLDDVWIIHDDADLPLGTIKVKKGGTSAGHRGIDSIDKNLGPDYWRIRVGIGRNEKGELSEYVLSTFNEDEIELVDKVIDQTSSYLIKSITDNILEIETINAKK